MRSSRCSPHLGAGAAQSFFGQDGEMMFAPFVDGAHLVRPTDVVNFKNRCSSANSGRRTV